jgi:uncharacterized membrane protein
VLALVFNDAVEILTAIVTGVSEFAIVVTGSKPMISVSKTHYLDHDLRGWQ